MGAWIEMYYIDVWDVQAILSHPSWVRGLK